MRRPTGKAKWSDFIVVEWLCVCVCVVVGRIAGVRFELTEQTGRKWRKWEKEMKTHADDGHEVRNEERNERDAGKKWQQTAQNKGETTKNEEKNEINISKMVSVYYKCACNLYVQSHDDACAHTHTHTFEGTLLHWHTGILFEQNNALSFQFLLRCKRTNRSNAVGIIGTCSIERKKSRTLCAQRHHISMECICVYQLTTAIVMDIPNFLRCLSTSCELRSASRQRTRRVQRVRCIEEK